MPPSSPAAEFTLPHEVPRPIAADALTRSVLPVTVELAFLGYPLESLARALDPVLIIFTIRWQQFDNLVSAVGGHVADGS